MTPVAGGGGLLRGRKVARLNAHDCIYFNWITGYSLRVQVVPPHYLPVVLVVVAGVVAGVDVRVQVPL